MSACFIGARGLKILGCFMLFEDPFSSLFEFKLFFSCFVTLGVAFTLTFLVTGFDTETTPSVDGTTSVTLVFLDLELTMLVACQQEDRVLVLRSSD